ncbi:MAG: ribose-phosphate pyrophosphokinase [Deltaproteobacteria bacterium]|nr:ribose-phosphate pyrophosphokinase [Deltaproteobacteria bacterium]
MRDALKIFAGNSNRSLAEEICAYVGVSLGAADIRRFSDGEIAVEITENVRGGDIFVLQSICSPGNDNLMEMLLMLDAFKRASANRITAVIPYYGYARQDRKVAPRVPISAKLVADLLTTAGASRVLTAELHAGQIQGFFNIPVDNLFSSPVLLQYLRTRIGKEQVTVVSPDAGGVERARAFAKRLGSSLAIIDKRRAREGERDIPGKANLDVVEMNIIGEVEGRVAILVDDMVDTAGTLTTAAAALHDAGAQAVFACCTHPVLSGPAIERIRASVLEELVVTNSVPLRPEAQQVDKIKVLSIAPLMGEAIRRIHHEESISSLFV